MMSEKSEQFAKQYHGHVYNVYQEGLGQENYVVLTWEEMGEVQRNALILAAQRFLNEEDDEAPEPVAVAPDFQGDLQSVLNRHCQEGFSNTPDFLLAEFIGKCIEAFNEATKARDSWYGVNLRPATSPPASLVLDSCDHGKVADGHCAFPHCLNYAGRFGQ